VGPEGLTCARQENGCLAPQMLASWADIPFGCLVFHFKKLHEGKNDCLMRQETVYA